MEEAFANTVYPGDENVSRGFSVNMFIGQRDWKTVPLEMLAHSTIEIEEFTPEAFHFYIPAYLCALLRFPEFAKDCLDYVLMSVFPFPPPGPEGVVRRAIKLFNTQQKAVIIEFLEQHAALFAGSNYVLLDEKVEELQQGIEFWRSHQDF
jgi:hypothetical protein